MKNLFLSILLCSFFAGLHSQPMHSPIVPASPEAAAIAKYQNYPVSYHTGLLNISIPLYEIRTGDLVLPISLNYHASGIKVKEPDGWIGTGWTLNAEPSITRSIKGGKDESDGYLTSIYDYPSYAPASEFYFRFDMDRDPDEFYYKLLDKSGGFYFRRRQTGEIGDFAKIVTHPYEPIVITSSKNNKNEYDLNWFSIIDEKGISYEFGKKGSRDETEWFDGISRDSYRTQWKALGVTSAQTGAKISFNYDDVKKREIRQLLSVISVEDSILVSTDEMFYPNCVGVSGRKNLPIIVSLTGNDRTYQLLDQNNVLQSVTDIQCGYSPFTTPGYDGFFNEKKIKEITFDGGKVVFLANQNGYLEFITVTNKLGDIIKRIRLVQSPYLYDRVIERYKLDEVQVLDTSGNIIERYRMDYDGSPLLQSRNEMDHWGFQSRVSNGGIPAQDISVLDEKGRRIPFPITIGSGSRDADFMGAQGGILKKITYPTGGYSEFYYEGHKFLDKNDQYVHCGGLRIKSIEDYDPLSNSVIRRRFEYGDYEDGIPRRIIKPSDYMTEQLRVTPLESPVYGDMYSQYQIHRYRKFTSSVSYDPFCSEGSSVVYSKVTEFYEGKDSINGKTEYLYAVNPDYNLNESWDPVTQSVADLKRGWKAGHLREQTDYKYKDGQYIRVQKKIYDYDYYKNSNIPVKKFTLLMDNASRYFIENSNFYIENNPVYYYTYAIYTGCKRLTKETQINYFNNGTDEVTVTKSYAYNPSTKHMQPTSITTTGSGGVLRTETFAYPEELGDNGTTGNVLFVMTERDNVISPVLSSTTCEVKGGTETGGQTSRTKYDIFDGVIHPKELQANTAPGGGFESRIAYNNYSAFGNPLCVTKDNAETVYLWGYNYRYPVAEIKNASIREVIIALSNQGGATIDYFAKKDMLDSADLLKINSLRTLLPNAQVTTYTYKPLVGILTITDPAGRRTSYEYDNANRLNAIRDHNGKAIESYQYKYVNP